MRFDISIHVPLRGTTINHIQLFVSIVHFNPRPLAGDDGVILCGACSKKHFNPRPLAGDDVQCKSLASHQTKFQSTSPCGGRLRPSSKVFCYLHFNPRPLAGDDGWSQWESFNTIGFQSTSPCGGRLSCNFFKLCGKFYFNPRPLAGDDGTIITNPSHLQNFNPRPLAGDDPHGLPMPGPGEKFQSTSPCGGRQSKKAQATAISAISIHVPLRGTTLQCHGVARNSNISIHVPLRGTTCDATFSLNNSIISIHVPLRGTTT